MKYLIQRMDEFTDKSGREARARGLEYQLVDIDAPDASDATRITGALYGLIAPSDANWKIGVFNESRIIVNHDHVEHWLNGRRILSFDITMPAINTALRNMLPKNSPAGTAIATESPISLQNHSSEVWFRNIKIRALP